jgi:SNF2 family DNA or RNA helicase
LILRELKLRGQVQRVLIIVPKGLALQWVEEMRTRFHESFRLIEPADLIEFERTPWEVNPWERFDQVIVTVDAVKPIETRRGWTADEIARHNQTRFEDLLAAGWDLIIVDEAHRMAGSSETVARYQLGKGLASASPYAHSGENDHSFRLMPITQSDASRSPNPLDGDQLGRRPFDAEQRTGPPRLRRGHGQATRIGR